MLRGLYTGLKHLIHQTFSMRRTTTENFQKLLNRPKDMLKLEGGFDIMCNERDKIESQIQSRMALEKAKIWCLRLSSMRGQSIILANDMLG